MADTPILNYKGKYDGPEIDKAVELALGLDNPKSCPYYVHVSLSKPDYVLTIGLGDSEGNLFNHTEIDLPLESMVVNATYENGNIILHLQDGTSTEPIPISALIAGLVSENRTVAGIDLKDNITSKELRDALDVYTKDSVDQLVSDLENTINETLISSVKNDVAINRATLGMQKKNLFDFEKFLTEREATFTKEGDEYTVTTNSALNTQKYYFAEENIRVIINGILTNVTSSNARISLIDTNGNVVNGYAIDATHTSTASVAAGLKFDWSSTGRFKINELMIRSADIADPTYEPYKPSVNERLVEVEDSVSELTPQVEQNKSDIATIDYAVGSPSKNLVIVRTSVSGEYYGTTWTKNADESITINGTVTQNNFPIIADFTPTKIGKYILSGCPRGGGNGSYQLYIEELGYDAGLGVTLNVTELKTYRVKIATYKNYTYDNLTFYPMIRAADITDGTYEPYKPSLQEQINNSYTSLSEQIEKHYGLGTIIPTGADLNNSIYFKPGVYRAPSNSVAESLLNCPVKRGFRMEVKTTIYDGMAVRFIYPNAHSALFGTYYMQNVISDGVSNWYKFSGEEIIPTSTTTE